ncbi:MAG: hypothetical protein ACOX4F_03310 [Atopobiaceae bacterium]
MILSRNDYQRLVEMLWALFDFAAARLDITDELYPTNTLEPNAEVQGSLMKYLWRDDPSAITDFTRTNPAHLPMKDIQEMRRWDQGIYGTFALCRDALGQSVFMGDGRGFVVSGINSEPWQVVTQLPTFVRTALIPFGDKIVYAGVLVEPQVTHSDQTRSLMQQELERRRQEGKLLTDARTFMRDIHDLRYGKRQHFQDPLSCGTNLSKEADLLASLRHAHMKSVGTGTDREELIRKLNHLPQGQHTGVLSGMNDLDRDRAARLHRHDLPASETFIPDVAVRRIMPVQPLEYAEELVRLRGLAPLAEISRECVQYFERNNIEGARPHQASLVSNELIARWKRSPDLVNFEVLDTDIGHYLVEYTLAKDNWNELTGLWHPDESDRDDGYPGTELGPTLTQLLENRAHLPARPVPDSLFEHLTDYFGWSLAQPPMIELRRYLDNHVPDGEDDYSYADEILGYVLECLHVCMSAEDIVWELYDRGVCPDQLSFDALEWLIAQVVDGMPNWACNGWSPKEARLMPPVT